MNSTPTKFSAKSECATNRPILVSIGTRLLHPFGITFRCCRATVNCRASEVAATPAKKLGPSACVGYRWTDKLKSGWVAWKNHAFPQERRAPCPNILTIRSGDEQIVDTRSIFRTCERAQHPPIQLATILPGVQFPRAPHCISEVKWKFPLLVA